MKKFLVIITGEAFRKGGYHSRKRDKAESIPEQLKASESQMDFLNFVSKKFNMGYDVSLNCYKSIYIDQLLNIYQPLYDNSNKYIEAWKQKKQTLQAIKDIPDLNVYESILILRVDLIIKEYFWRVFDPLCEKIMFPCIMHTSYCKVRNTDLPRVVDTFMFIPKKQFDNILNRQIWDIAIHTSYFYCIEGGLSHSHLGFYTNTYHDSNTQHCWNPLYTICNRPVSTSWSDYNKHYNEHNEMIHSANATIKALYGKF